MFRESLLPETFAVLHGRSLRLSVKGVLLGWMLLIMPKSYN